MVYLIYQMQNNMFLNFYMQNMYQQYIAVNVYISYAFFHPKLYSCILTYY